MRCSSGVIAKNLDETKIIFFETDENIQSGHRVQFWMPSCAPKRQRF